MEEIGGEFVVLRVKDADWQALAAGDLVRVSKNTRLNDCKFNAQVGDEVMVYYDGREGNWKRGDVPEIYEVHGYCLITPAERAPK